MCFFTSDKWEFLYGEVEPKVELHNINYIFTEPKVN